MFGDAHRTFLPTATPLHIQRSHITLRSSECYLEVAGGLNESHQSHARVRVNANVWRGKCVCGSRRQKALSSIITALCVWVCDHTPPTYLNVHYHTETHSSDSCHHCLLLSPPYPTNHLSLSLFLSLFIILSESRTHLHKAGFELQSCKVSMWWEQSCTRQVNTLWESVCVFLFLETLISCHLKVFLCKRGNTHWSREDQFACVWWEHLILTLQIFLFLLATPYQLPDLWKCVWEWRRECVWEWVHFTFSQTWARIKSEVCGCVFLFFIL